MKKIITTVLLIASVSLFAQRFQMLNSLESTKSGQTMIGITTSGFGVEIQKGVTTAKLGVEIGRFISDDLAVVGKLGYEGIFNDDLSKETSNNWGYGFGAKYYLKSMIPIQLDHNGFSGNDYSLPGSFMGLQLGYAWFPSDFLSVEPRVRYDKSLNKIHQDKYSFGVGVYVHF